MDLTSLCARSGHLVILLLGNQKRMEYIVANKHIIKIEGGSGENYERDSG